MPVNHSAKRTNAKSVKSYSALSSFETLPPIDFHPTAKQMSISSGQVAPKGHKEVW